MSETPVQHLRKALVRGDRQILDILAPLRPLNHDPLKTVACLGRARGSIERLIAAAEADAPEGDA